MPEHDDATTARCEEIRGRLSDFLERRLGAIESGPIRPTPTCCCVARLAAPAPGAVVLSRIDRKSER